MRWKALAEIYTMHSFAPFWNRIPKNEENHGGEKILAPFSKLNFLFENREKSFDFFAKFAKFVKISEIWRKN